MWTPLLIAVVSELLALIEDVKLTTTEENPEVYCTLNCAMNFVINIISSKTRSPAIAEGPRDAGVPVEIW